MSSSQGQPIATISSGPTPIVIIPVPDASETSATNVLQGSASASKNIDTSCRPKTVKRGTDQTSSQIQLPTQQLGQQVLLDDQVIIPMEE